jgi:hypothetical protein
LLDLVKEPLDQVARAIQIRAKADRIFAIAILGGGNTGSGVRINQTTAVSISTVGDHASCAFTGTAANNAAADRGDDIVGNDPGPVRDCFLDRPGEIINLRRDRIIARRMLSLPRPA